MKNFVVATGLFLGVHLSAIAQNTDTTKKYTPKEKVEVNEASQLRKTMEEKQLAAPFEKVYDEQKVKAKKEKAKCKKRPSKRLATFK